MTRSSKTLHHLIYCSRVRIPWPDQEREVAQILAASAANNEPADVTGLLLLHDGWFVQALEGPVENVLTTYGRICNDPRHNECKVLSAGPAEHRSFGAWNMCARRLTPTDDAILQTLQMKGLFEPFRLTGKQALRLLQAVRGVQRGQELRRAG
jgi:hypothetical protein